MNHRRALGMCAVLVLLAAAAAAQQPPTGQWFLLHQEAAKPSKVAEFESSTKEFIALVTQHRATMPDFSFNCLQGEDFMYTFVVPIQGFAGVDKVMANFGAYMQAAGPKAAEIFSRSGASYEYTNEWVVAHAPELSYSRRSPASRSRTPSSSSTRSTTSCRARSRKWMRSARISARSFAPRARRTATTSTRA